jgi:hypothetical protein
MKQRVAVTAMVFLVLAASTASAQPGYFSSKEEHKTAKLGKAVNQYCASLTHENAGVVESALAHLVRMKLFVPDLNSPEVAVAIRMVAVSGETPRVRHRAYLASLVFDTPGMFTEESSRLYNGPDDLFSSIAARTNVAYLSSENK